MQNLFTNWQTSLTGVVIIGLGALGTFLGIKIPGFTMDFGTALAMGIGLILAKDGAPK